MATKVTYLTIMSTLQVDGGMTTTGTTPAPASNQGGSKDPVPAGSSGDPCGFPVDMLQYQFIDIRKCAVCGPDSGYMDTVTRTVPYVSNYQFVIYLHHFVSVQLGAILK